jgi:hypothetical protein
MNQINMMNNPNLMAYMQQMIMNNNLANYNNINQMQVANMYMTKEDQEKYKEEQRIQGYLFGKEYVKMLKEQEQKSKEKSEKPENDSSNNNKNSTTKDTKDTKDASDVEKNKNNKITIKFNKGGTITEIEIGSDAGVFELINEYFTKSNTQSGTFKFKENNLLPTDISELNEIGLKNGDEIMVS